MFTSRLPLLILTGLAAATIAFTFRVKADRGTTPELTPSISPNRGAIRSVTYEARREPPVEDITAIADLGATHVTLIPFGFQQSSSAREIRYNPEARWYTESDAGIKTISRWARDAGLEVIIKPHIWVGRYNGEGDWRDKISFESEDDWAAWESSYKSFILHYAGLAQAVDADIFVIGTELAAVARTRPQFWRNIIKDVRSAFDGQLSYAANWWEEYEHVTFWDDLDYIGVQAYFPIYEGNERPDVPMLVAGWDRHAKHLEALSNKYKRPVLFTEIGYRSVAHAPARPWEWAPRRNEASDEVPDDAMQQDLYAAMFDAVWHQPWFAGAILWKWHASTETRQRPTDFSPQNKPAELLIRERFNRLSADR